MRKEIKPDVNFTEFKCDSLLMEAWKSFQPLDDENTCFTWEQLEGIIIERFKLTGRRLDLFIGHSRRWAGTDLVN